MYIHIYAYVYVYIYIHMLYTHIYTYIHLCIHIIYIYIQIHICAHINQHIPMVSPCMYHIFWFQIPDLRLSLSSHAKPRGGELFSASAILERSERIRPAHSVLRGGDSLDCLQQKFHTSWEIQGQNMKNISDCNFPRETKPMIDEVCLDIFGTSQSFMRHIPTYICIYIQNHQKIHNPHQKMIQNIPNYSKGLHLSPVAFRKVLLGPNWCPEHGSRARVGCGARLGWGT